jgi:hypothetical protein
MMMAQDKRKRWIVLIWVVLAGLAALAVYLFYGARVTGNRGFPLDDSWIHMQIARNLATGRGWSYNPGEPTGASTTPLWVLALAPLHLRWSPRDPVTAVKVLGSLLFLASLVLVALLAWRVSEDGRVALVAGLLAAWQPALVWGALSGMETPLYLPLVLLGLLSLLRAESPHARSAYGATFWLTLAGWARPEVWVLLPVAWAYLTWRRRELRAGRLWVHVLIAAAGIGAFALFNVAVWGQPLPATWHAKTAFTQGNLSRGPVDWLLHFSEQAISSIQAAVYSQNPVLVMTLVLGCVAAWRAGGARWRRVVLLLAVVLAGIVTAALADLGTVGFQNYRRAASLVACMNILVALGAVALWDALTAGIRWPLFGAQRPPAEAPARAAATAGRRTKMIVVVSAALVALAMQAAGLREGAKLYANDVRSINQGDVAPALWLAANTSPDARIAVNDIGALAYFGGRHITDLVGLASPEAIKALKSSRAESEDRDRRLSDLIIAEGVDYVVIFPQWFPWLAQDPRLVEVKRFTVPRPTMIASGNVVVYRVVSP